MSKERFEYKKHEFIYYISDNKTGIMYNVTNHNKMTDMTKLLNKQSQRIAELEEQLGNAIVLPINNNKFYYICYPMQEVIEYCVCKLSLDRFTTNDHDTWLMNEFGTDWFTTKEEAQAKLEELQGEINEICKM